jgi:inositol-phosphate phosphatase / L-galactose 1-phosphate phosphatase / histidinol-phosphatase
MPPCPPDLVIFAHALGDIAGDLLRRSARDPVAVETKADGSPVTALDRAVETALRDAIRRVHPGHGVIGEEFGADRADAEWVWILDPLDGTREFIQGLPLFGTLIALAYRQEIVLGLAEQPLTRDRFVGADGHGSSWNGAPICVRPCAALAEAVLSTTGYDGFAAHRYDALRALRRACRGTANGDTWMVFGLLAAGRIDAVASDGFFLHDYAALDAIVRNAGGRVTDWAGRRLTLASDRSILAAGNARLHAELLQALAA